MNSNTTKWISRINSNLVGSVNYWRKFTGSVECGYGTKPTGFNIYIAANGFNPTWGPQSPYAPDGSYVYASYTPTQGGNTGWMNIPTTSNRNAAWIDDPAGGYKYWWGNGKSGYATKLASDANRIDLYYYNMASFSPNVSWWWYGTCGTAYATQTSKGSGTDVAAATMGVGNPGAVYNGVSTGFTQTAAGNSAIQ